MGKSVCVLTHRNVAMAEAVLKLSGVHNADAATIARGSPKIQILRQVVDIAEEMMDHEAERRCRLTGGNILGRAYRWCKYKLSDVRSIFFSPEVKYRALCRTKLTDLGNDAELTEESILGTAVIIAGIPDEGRKIAQAIVHLVFLANSVEDRRKLLRTISVEQLARASLRSDQFRKLCRRIQAQLPAEAQERIQSALQQFDGQ